MLTRFIFSKILGWSIEGAFDPAIKKSVVIVLPHTSWHDFYVGALTRKLLGIQINYVAKKELFKWPFGWYFRWMGGAPLDRTPGQNKVGAIAQIFESKEEFRLAMAPEGTRKKVTRWKTGFYYIALDARVPIIPVAFDYATRTVKIGEAFWPTSDQEKDLETLAGFYKGVVGKIPEYT
jgi:1-acyl-sn-glycerol-3-phosphate acyltransferase